MSSSYVLGGPARPRSGRANGRRRSASGRRPASRTPPRQASAPMSSPTARPAQPSPRAPMDARANRTIGGRAPITGMTIDSNDPTRPSTLSPVLRRPRPAVGGGRDCCHIESTQVPVPSATSHGPTVMPSSPGTSRPGDRPSVTTRFTARSGPVRRATTTTLAARSRAAGTCVRARIHSAEPSSLRPQAETVAVMTAHRNGAMRSSSVRPLVRAGTSRMNGTATSPSSCMTRRESRRR